MSKLAWISVGLLVLGAGLWELWREPGTLFDPVVGILLFIAGALGGFQVGHDSGTQMMADMFRLNRLLGEQNTALVEQNDMLLKLLKASAEPPA